MNIIDMHCDTLNQIYDRRAEGESVFLCEDSKLCVSLDKLEQGDYLLQNFAVFVDMEGVRENTEPTDEKGEAPYRQARKLVQIFEEEMAANSERIRPVTSFAELQANEQEGQRSALLTLEEGGVCLGEIEKLREFYQRGARMMTLTWNYENEIGYPAAMQPAGSAGYRANEKRTFGLKETGIQFLSEMERLGMIVDVSHLSDDGFFDICELAKRPFVASHSNARALCGHRRNLTDEMLRMLGERGSIAGLNLCPEFVIAQQQPDGKRVQDGKNLLEYLACHAVHMMNVGGSGCVGLGSDFDGFDEASIPQNAAGMQDLAWVLHKMHVSDDRIDDIFYRNVYNLYREVL